MKGAIIGDIIGSVYEGHRNDVEDKNFQLFRPDSHFTDDTVLTVAVAEHLLTCIPLNFLLKRYFTVYPNRGYGGMFKEWCLSDNMEPFGSYANGGAMRVSPVALLYDTVEQVVAMATATAEVTHSHEHGIEGAVAVALATYGARKKMTKDEIRDLVMEHTSYNLDLTLAEAVSIYGNGVLARQSCPTAIVAFLVSESFEDCIRTAIYAGGDSDTIAAMAGGIAEQFYGLDARLWARAEPKLLPDFKAIVDRFYEVAAHHAQTAP